MLLERETIVEILRTGGHHDLALQVECALPRYFDADADTPVLHRLGISPGMLLEDLEAGVPRSGDH